jgi:hypothetical protein
MIFSDTDPTVLTSGADMAKAQFHRNQRVWVETVGTWATIEKIVPAWAKGFDEPVRITYDVGLGREFLAHDLQAEEEVDDTPKVDGATWRLMRARNKWQSAEDCADHPYPGTFPVVVTDANDWGGWRVPGAEGQDDAPLAIRNLADKAAALERYMDDIPAAPEGETPESQAAK